MAVVGKCRKCNKIVYPLEAVTATKYVWHKGCFKCDVCGWQLTLTNYKCWEDGVYCKNHYPVTGFGEKHVLHAENLDSVGFKTAKDAPKLDTQKGQVLTDEKQSPRVTLDDFQLKIATNAPKLDMESGVQKMDKRPSGQKGV